MQAHSLTESAAIVKILQQFFDGSTQDPENKAIIATLKAVMVALPRRLTILEQAVSLVHRFSKSPASRRVRTPPSLSPLNSTELARRLGVNVSTLEEES